MRRKQSRSDLRGNQVVVIAARRIHVEIGVEPKVPVLKFTSIDQFERALLQSHGSGVTLELPLRHALRDIGVRWSSLPPDLRHLFAWLCMGERLPHLKKVIERFSSRSLFYRRWDSSIPETAARFIRRVRVHHALHLMRLNYPEKTAVQRAGLRNRHQLNGLAAEFGIKVETS